MTDFAWIPCYERLPEHGEDVIIWFEHGPYTNDGRRAQEIGISFTLNGEWSGFINYYGGWKDVNVIAWMPLPKPYNSKRN